MMAGMVARDRARPAALRPARRCCSTIGAMLGIFGWTREFASMRFFVTRNAQRQPVIDGKCKVGKLSQGLYVMGLNVALFAAFLAGIVITHEYRFSPFCEVAFVLAAAAVLVAAQGLGVDGGETA